MINVDNRSGPPASVPLQSVSPGTGVTIGPGVDVLVVTDFSNAGGKMGVVNTNTGHLALLDPTQPVVPVNASVVIDQ
jgi:hypothetical protein